MIGSRLRTIWRKAPGLLLCAVILPAIIRRGAFRTRRMTSADCMAIARRMPRRLGSRLCRHYRGYYSQLTEIETIHFTVIHVITRLFGIEVDIDVRCDSPDLVQQIAQAGEPWIISPLHYEHSPFMTVIYRHMPHKVVTMVVADPDYASDDLVGRYGDRARAIRYVTNRKGCLETLTLAEPERALLVCSPDIAPRPGGICSLVRGGIFAHALRTGMKHAAVRYTLASDGAIVVGFRRIDGAGSVAEGMARYIAHQQPDRNYVAA